MASTPPPVGRQGHGHRPDQPQDHSRLVARHPHRAEQLHRGQAEHDGRHHQRQGGADLQRHEDHGREEDPHEDRHRHVPIRGHRPGRPGGVHARVGRLVLVAEEVLVSENIPHGLVGLHGRQRLLRLVPLGRRGLFGPHSQLLGVGLLQPRLGPGVLRGSGGPPVAPGGLAVLVAEHRPSRHDPRIVVELIRSGRTGFAEVVLVAHCNAPFARRVLNPGSARVLTPRATRPLCWLGPHRSASRGRG